MRGSIKLAVILTCVAVTGEETSEATVIVHDPGLALQQSVHHGLDYVQYFQTQINTYLHYRELVLEVARLGNVQEVANLIGMSEVGDLITTDQTPYGEYQELKSLTDPRTYQSDINSILNTYRQQTWQGFLTARGYWVAPNQGAYQFATTDYNTAKQTIDILERLQKQRERLEQDLKGLQSRMKSASTHAEALKLNGQIAVVSAELNDVEGKIRATAERSHLQQVQTDAAEKIYRGTQLERQDAAEKKGVDHELEQLPASMYGTTIHW